MIKIFISHKNEDVVLAHRIAVSLMADYRISTYLDELDPHLSAATGELTDHLRNSLGECTHLLAVLSSRTKQSWWVPFEIGLATEKGYPISTFAAEVVDVPDYLRRWPYLRSELDLSEYVTTILALQEELGVSDLRKIARSERGNYAQQFHSVLRRRLGQ